MDKASLVIEENDRLCLVGRNGEGKSSLLRILEGAVAPDSGELETKPGICIRKMDQEIPEAGDQTVFDVVSGGLGNEAETVAAYHRVAREYSANPRNPDLARDLDSLQDRLDNTGGWEIDRKVETILQRVELVGEIDFNSLSGGEKRRALLAKALVVEPDLLLLDEPTNHIDIPGIRWLEEFFRRTEIALLFVSHDRGFVRRLASGIMDIDRGRLTRWDCGFDEYLVRKQEWLDGEAKRNEVFDKKLSQEAFTRREVDSKRNSGKANSQRGARKSAEKDEGGAGRAT